MLIFSGVRSAYRKTRSAIGRPNRIGVEHSHDDLDPMHLHADDGMAVAVAEDLPVSEWHHGHHGRPGHHHHKHPEPDAFMEYGRGTAFVVGMVHGIGAETPTQILVFLAAARAGGTAIGIALLICFIIGLLASNTVVALTATFGFLRASRNFALYATVSVLTAVFSLVVGVLLLTGYAPLLPALTG